MGHFDDRIFRVVFEYGGTKENPAPTTSLTFDGGLDIKASGTKYANALQNECRLTISNLKKETRNQLATQLTPYNYDQARKSVSIYAGRESTGLFLLYKGDIIEATISQPPDVTLNIRSMALAWYKLNYVAQAHNISSPLSAIANGIGFSLGTPVDFQATDKSIANYSYSGSAAKQIDKLNEMGVDAYEDNGTLIVKDTGSSLSQVHVLSKDSGMIGTPTLTEYGVRVKMLLAPSITLGGQIDLNSSLNPVLNGKYQICKLGFEIASRDTPFYGIAECSKYPILYGVANVPNA